MTLSLNIVETRVPKRYMSLTNKGGERFRAIVEFDKANKAIRLTPTDDTKGFSFSTGRSTYNAQSTFPVKMKRAGMDRGDYILVDADRLIFQLADVANQQQDVREY